MNDSARSGDLFWSSEGPLASLACAGLVVVSSGRLAYALAAGFALVFVELVTILCLNAGRSLLPPAIRGGVAVILSSCFAAVFLLILSLFSPLFSREVTFFVSLTPVVFIASGIVDRSADDPISDSVARAGIESVLVLALVVAFSLLREPLGYGDLSLPGPDGIVLIFASSDAPAFAVRAMAGTVGGFILLAYVVVAFRKVRSLLAETGNREEA